MAQFAKNMFDLWPLLAVLLLLASFGPWLGNAKKRRPKPEPEFRLDEAAELDARKFEGGKCAFFCFFVPLEDDKLIDLHIYKNMSCSDIVYGFAQVQDEDLRLPTKQDLLRHSYYGNFKLITSLQRISSSPRVHLGMKLSPDARFLNSVDNVELAANISRRMAFYARRYGFSGIFLKFDSEVLMSPAFAQFAELLSDELKAEQKRTGARKLDLILSISSNWVRYIHRRMPRFDSFFDTFYLWADEIDSAGHELPAKAIPVDPLHHSAQVGRADSLAENAERLAGTGVSRRKIIIGLSAWARSYVLHNADDPTTVPAEVADFGFPGEETQQTDGKLAYQEICQLIEEEPLQHDNMSETVSLRQGDLWYSFNEPEHPALVQKLEWIANHEFGGVGLYSLQADDPNGNCSRRGMFPLHRSVASHFKCRRGTKRGNSEQLGECMRLCMFDLDEDAGGASNNFHFEQLRPGWCSHLVLGQATVNPFMTANFGPSKGMRRALSMYNDWERERKPFLILSFTGTADKWRLATMATARYMLIEGIRRLLDEHNADGVDLNCENGGPDGPNQAFQMIQFLADLRRTLGNKKQILLSLNPNSFIDNRFDFPAMERSVDFFVTIGYRYHRYTNAYTGHHSPLFKNSTLLNQPKMTIQGTVEEMLAGEVPREKLIVALSAEAMSQHFVDDIRTHRSWESRKIGESAARIHNRNRAHGAGTVSQTEVCELMKKETTVSHFLNELGVPYLVNDEREFIAFDSKRSIQIKTVWLSLQGLAGVGLHGLQLDNIAGECPLGEPFPLLRTIVQSQICAKCPPSTAKDPTMPTTSTQLMTTEIPTATVEGLSTSTDYPDLPTEAGGMGSTSASPAADESTPSPRVANFAHCRLSGSRPAAGDNSSASQFLTHCAVTWASLGKNLSVDELPLERCDSLLLTGWAKLDGQGVASAETGIDESKTQMLAKLAEIARDNGTELWAEVPCAMEPRQWVALLDEKREQVASSLAQMLISKNLSGLLLDCDYLMAPAHRTSFSQLLNEINAEIAERSEQQAAAADKEEDDKAKCTSRLALRMQLSRSNISEVYVPEQLNQLLKHVFLPSGVATSKAMAKLLNPLFALGIANQEGTDTQNGTFNAWLADGLQPKLVVMELPAHAIRQKREQEEAEPETVGQEKVCQFMRKPGAQHFTRYDAVAAYWKTKDDWLSAENTATIKYKVQFAMQHHLGGFLLRSLDADDPDDRCNNGAGFPLLAAARAASCDQPKAAMQAKTRHGRDMLGTMVFSRGRR